ncbi:hypothetical protein, partial [Sinorhizobium meliloti]
PPVLPAGSLLAKKADLRESFSLTRSRSGQLPRVEKNMPVKSLVAAVIFSLFALSGCASTGSTNTTYTQWYGPYPEPEFDVLTPGGLRLAY